MQVSYAHSSWDTMMPGIAQGEYDIGMDGITIKADRAKKVDFSSTSGWSARKISSS